MATSRAPRKAAAPKPPLEKYIERAIMGALRLHGCFVQKIRQGAFKPRTGRKRFVRLGCEPGTPDLLVTIGPMAFRIEVKRPGEKLLPSQVVWHAKAKLRGEPVFIAYSVNDALDALEQMKGAVKR